MIYIYIHKYNIIYIYNDTLQAIGGPNYKLTMKIPVCAKHIWLVNFPANYTRTLDCRSVIYTHIGMSKK